ncbi:hypothetical protein ABZW10_11060 [Kitasatospora sp. NPDC004723]|uniref:hypothetical protein n=1 Tax=Kitasatospora sp. NPDC004723 TaxID=3154288 RepID=UPI0033B2C039
MLPALLADWARRAGEGRHPGDRVTVASTTTGPAVADSRGRRVSPRSLKRPTGPPAAPGR